MAGHSKWANIKFRKGAQDAKRGKLFTKFIREITVSSRIGGPDPDSNPRLRTAVDKALTGNMTRDTVNRAIKRGAGGEEGSNLEEVRYEGYGIGGVAVLVECLTDNLNRTVSEVRHAFTKHGGNLGTNGSVAYLFNKTGQIIITDASEDDVMEIALEAGADDIINNGDNIEVRTNVDDFNNIKDKLAAANFKIQFAEISMVANETIELDPEQSEKFMKLIDRLEDLDDVQDVFSNAYFRD